MGCEISQKWLYKTVFDIKICRAVVNILNGLFVLIEKKNPLKTNS